MKTAIVCMAKDEDHYIDEWIDYHHRLGFDDFYIYRDNWDGMTEMMKKDFCHVRDVKDVVDDYGKEVPFDLKQKKLYGKALDMISGKCDFCAVIDVDEFINLKKHKDIKTFLENYIDVHGVVLNWFLFGDSNLTDVNGGDYSCVNRFVHRGKNIHGCVKTIYNMNKICEDGIKLDGIAYVHGPKDFNGLKICTADKQCLIQLPDDLWIPGTDKVVVEHKQSSAEIACINHYIVKTLEEFKVKYERNSTSSWEKANKWKFNGIEDRFRIGNINQVFDDSLKRRYYEMKTGIE